MKQMNRIYIPILLLSVLLPFSAHADELSDLREVVSQQQTRIESLSEKINGMEDESVSRFGWNLGLFGDANYSTKSREHPHDSFHIQELSLYSTANYGERLNFLTEIAFEEEEADVERVWIGYAVSDLLTIRAGKFHTALGYWNKTYHHGRQLFTTVDRPFFLVFEHDGGVLPIHITGLEIEGSKALGIGRLKYEFELGNGPEMIGGMLEPNNDSDNNSSKQPVLRVSLKPSAIQGLSVGIFATSFKVDTTTIAKKGLDETIHGADVFYTRSGLELLSEVFLFHNEDKDGNAFYAQLAYTTNVWTPYFRFERLEVQNNDPYFIDLGVMDRSQTIVGLKYDIDPVKSSIKAQYRRDDSDDDYNVFETQWSFHF